MWPHPEAALQSGENRSPRDEQKDRKRSLEARGGARRQTGGARTRQEAPGGRQNTAKRTPQHTRRRTGPPQAAPKRRQEVQDIGKYKNTAVKPQVYVENVKNTAVKPYVCVENGKNTEVKPEFLKIVVFEDHRFLT